jgi:hypothetical protein
MTGVTGVLATDTGLASCTSAFSSSSINESSSECSDTLAEITKFSGTGLPRLVREAFELSDVCRKTDLAGGGGASVSVSTVRGSSGFKGDILACSGSFGASEALDIGDFFFFSVSYPAFGVTDELVSEERESRRFSTSWLVRDEPLDAASDKFVSVVGEAVLDARVALLSAGSRVVLVVLVLANDSLGAWLPVDVDVLCAMSIFFLRICSAFISLSFSGVALAFSVVTEAGLRLARLTGLYIEAICVGEGRGGMT